MYQIMIASCNNAPKCSFYNVSTKTPWNELIGDALVLAKKVRISVLRAVKIRI